MQQYFQNELQKFERVCHYKESQTDSIQLQLQNFIIGMNSIDQLSYEMQNLDTSFWSAHVSCCQDFEQQRQQYGKVPELDFKILETVDLNITVSIKEESSASNKTLEMMQYLGDGEVCLSDNDEYLLADL